MENWPDARVAIQPPTVDRAMDWGQWPVVRPCAATASSAARPFMPASKLAVRFTGSMDRTRFRAPRSSSTASGPAMTPPTTPLPWPKGISGVPFATHALTVACTSATEAGRTTQAGMGAPRPCRSRRLETIQ